MYILYDLFFVTKIIYITQFAPHSSSMVHPHHPQQQCSDEHMLPQQSLAGISDCDG
jgi:hypothetical protein